MPSNRYLDESYFSKSKFENTYTHCLGRMVNLFELNLGLSANRLLTDKPHRDGSSVTRSRSDLSTMSPCADQIEDKVIVSEFKSTNSKQKSNGTPIKMLIAQEMSKEVDSRHGPPSLIAKLMGLDTLPDQDPGSAMEKSRLAHNRCHSEIPASNWEQQNGLFHYVEPNDYKDLYEIWKQSLKSTHKGICDETAKQKKMAFVRQKFIEAKRLSMDEKLRQSKQFQDALEVLNSNKELFLRCLQEPNSVFSQQLHNLQSIPPPPETKRITVLKPSTIIEGNHLAGAGNKDGRQLKKNVFAQINDFEKGGKSPHANCPNNENPTQPTRIVVLKPKMGKVHQDAAIGSPQSPFARIHGEDLAGNDEDSENLDSKAVAKAITHQMRQKLGRQHRGEIIISSACSNGYAADESSFNKSEGEFPTGTLSDSEVMSPVSRHSWDYVNRIESPYSSSSYSRASCSPESSVCREAKKRLSERWAMMASHASFQDQRLVQKSSSTLGEMLALSETKKTEVPEKCSSSEEPKDLKSLFVNEPRPDDHLCNSPHKLDRSKSVPVSSTPFGTKLDGDSPVSDKGKQVVHKEDSTAKSVKSSFRGKVSSLFFSRNKKNSKDKTLGEVSSDRTGSWFDREPDPALSGHLGSSNTTSSLELPGIISSEARLSVARSIASGNSCKNQDQPSPIFVLDPPFEANEHTAKLFPGYLKSDRHGSELSLNSLGSNLIDKSPPIGSIARTLSWNDSCVETASLHPIQGSFPIQGRGDDREDWSLFLKTLLSVAGLQGELQPSSVLARWHSPECPLDPSLRDKYIDLNEKGTMHEAKRRQKRSMQKLVFDCVNAALIDITGHALVSVQRAIPCIEPVNRVSDHASSTTVFDEVWTWINAFMGGEIRCVWDECGDDNSMVVESVVRKEVAGNGWIEQLRFEMDSVGMEIEGELLEQLVDEAVVELAGRT